MARVKFDLNKPKHERIPKKTSIGRRPKMSSMNKHKKRSYKRKNRGGMQSKTWYIKLGGYVMEKIIETIKHYWTDHKVVAGIVIAAIIVAIIW